jgi:CRISPR/Cas system-associated exonuclease Cas4 (RecB family)
VQERNLKDIYNLYLLHKNDHNTAVRYRDKSWFHSSDAGLCIRKHYFSSVSQVEGTPVSGNTQRIFRLGNIVHEDIQNALTWYSQIHGLPLLIEKEIYLEDLNVRGYIDLALIDLEGDDHVLYDIKTSNLWGWTKMFGKSGEGARMHHKMQLATYGLWAKLHYNLDNIKMKLCYYNKNTSIMKEIDVPEEYLGEAYEYWNRVNLLVADKTLPEVDLGISPAYEWECQAKYCKFYEVCGRGIYGK